MTSSELGGLSGWVADVVAALGWVGVALLTALENLFPPIPSEVVLPLAGYLASEGRLSVGLAMLGATVGALVGAAVLFEAARALGWRRLTGVLTSLPLVDDDDLERARDWFDRHRTAAVFTGRLVPGVRSLISVPAGVSDMTRGTFYLLTLAGSAAWNALLIGAGWFLGDRWEDLERYSSWIDLAVLGAVVVAVVRFVWNRRRRVAEAIGAS